MKLFTTSGEWCSLDSANGRKWLKDDMLRALEYPDEYGLKKRPSKGSKCYEITVTIKRVKVKSK